MIFSKSKFLKPIVSALLVLLIISQISNVFAAENILTATIPEKYATRQQLADFLNTVGPAATRDMIQNDILASLTVAQAIQESGWGTSSLATIGKALFGIKAYSNWSGAVYATETKIVYNSYTEAIASTSSGKYYRAYDSWQDSIDDHSRLFNTSKLYENLRGLKDYKLACYYVREDGYTSDEDYSETLVYLIETYNLTQYDVTNTTIDTPSEPEPVYPSSVTVSASSVALDEKKQFTITAEILPKDAVDNLVWTTDDSDVATVKNGVVTAVSSGSAVITVKTANQLSVDCKITVTRMSDMIVVDDKLISYTGNASTVYFPSRITAIKADAFIDCGSAVHNLVIPSTVTSIEKNAFKGVSSLKIFASPDSAAEKYATDNEISCYDISKRTYTVNDTSMMITGFAISTSIADVYNYYFSKGKYSVEIDDKNGDKFDYDSDSNLTTGTKIILSGSRYSAVIIGDVNCDGVLNTTDYLLVSRYFNKSIELSAAARVAADTDCDKRITTTDYIRIKRHIQHLIDIYE